MKVSFDDKKAESNLRNHGVRFDEAQTVLMDAFAVTNEDYRDYGEVRYFTIGMSANGNVLIVVWTSREPDEIRIISSWKASKQQVKSYEQRK